MNSEQVGIVLKAWETYQSLIKGMGENCWKIRSVFYTAAFGLVAAGFSANLVILYLLLPCLAIAFFFLEAGYRRLQQQYIEKSIEIERSLNAVLVGDEPPYLPNEGVTTSIDTPGFRDIMRLFQPRRYLFWFSYLIIFVIGFVLYAIHLTPINSLQRNDGNIGECSTVIGVANDT